MKTTEIARLGGIKDVEGTGIDVVSCPLRAALSPHPADILLILEDLRLAAGE